MSEAKNDTEKKNKCHRCLEEKSVSQFHIQRNTKDGLRNTCIDCDQKRKKDLRSGSGMYGGAF